MDEIKHALENARRDFDRMRAEAMRGWEWRQRERERAARAKETK